MSDMFGMTKYVCYADTWELKNFNNIALSHIVKEVEAILCFCQKLENSKWTKVFERQIFFKDCAEYFA